MLTKHRIYRLASKNRMIIFLAQMTKPYMAKLRSCKLSQQIRSLFVAQVALIATDAVLQESRILAHAQHIHIMIRLQHQIIGQPHLFAYGIRNMPDIGYKTETHAICFYNITHTIAAVVRNIKRSYAERSDLQHTTFL